MIMNQKLIIIIKVLEEESLIDFKDRDKSGNDIVKYNCESVSEDEPKVVGLWISINFIKMKEDKKK